jgi:hypothetical protein
MPRIAAALLVSSIATATAHANEIWVAPTHQQDVGGLGVGSNGIWPVTAAGVVRLAWAIPDDLKTFQSARLVLIPQAPAAGATLTLFVCEAAGSEMVSAACAGPQTRSFSSVANQLLEIDISTVIAPQVGTAGQSHLAVVAFTSSATTDRILGLRFAYDPALPDGAATLGANTYTGTQTAPAFVGSGAGLTNLPFPAGAATLGANTFTGTQTAPGFAGSGTALTGVAKLTANTFTGTQTIGVGNLNLGSVDGGITWLGSSFMHARSSGTFLGSNAGINIVGLAENNTGIGLRALGETTSGTSNTAVGDHALAENETGGGNIAVGVSALEFGTSPVSNVAIGNLALFRTTGSRNVAIGPSAGFQLVTGDDNIYLKNVGAANESDTIRIGDVQTRTFIRGIRSVTTGQANAIPVLIDAGGQLGTISSSRRYKEDIQDMAGTSSRLLDLRPVAFRYSKAFADGGQPVQYGLIAEEVANVFPELVVRDEEGRPDTVAYQNLSVLLLNELQKLSRDHRAQQARIDALERELAALRQDRRQ